MIAFEQLEGYTEPILLALRLGEKAEQSRSDLTRVVGPEDER